MSGVDYTTVNRNQHIPQCEQITPSDIIIIIIIIIITTMLDCGSCWAMATTSALSDRMKLSRKAAYPDIDLSPQVLINCVTVSTC